MPGAVILNPAVQGSASIQQAALTPTGAISEAGVGRSTAMASQGVLTSGTLRLGALQVLRGGRAINTLTIASGSTAAVTPTNQWFCLVRVSDLAVLVKTVDDLTTAWNASSLKALATASTYTPAVDELAWIGVLVVAATVPTLVGWSVGIAAIAALTPVLCGNSTTPLTVPGGLGPTALTPGASSSITHWGYTS